MTAESIARARRLCAAALVAAGLQAHAADPAPRVVVSIKPVHSLVAGVMGETGRPRLMVAGAASPHMYQMRPSEARALHDADLVVWVGETLETFLERAIDNLDADTEVVALSLAAGMRLLPNREGGVWAKEGESHAGHDGHAHGYGEFDSHIWLDPGNASRIADYVATALARLDPARADAYRENAAAMSRRIAAQGEALRELLAPVREHAFIVVHDGYRYFEHAFGLNGVGAVAVDPSRPPGARRLSELRGALAEHDVRCVFTEPQFEPDLARTLLGGTRVATAALDPFGLDASPGADAWFAIMRGLGEAFAQCLGAR